MDDKHLCCVNDRNELTILEKNVFNNIVEKLF